jgi:hypothetical protein
MAPHCFQIEDHGSHTSFPFRWWEGESALSAKAVKAINIARTNALRFTSLTLSGIYVAR